MFDRLVENLGRASVAGDAAQIRNPETQLAAAMLLYAVLPADNVIRPEESFELRLTLQRLLRVGDVQAQHLISRAVSAYSREPSLLACATILKHRFTLGFRNSLFEAARRIAAADGQIHVNEADVLSRITSLLGLNAMPHRLSA